jgi:chromosome segregation ATPase
VTDYTDLIARLEDPKRPLKHYGADCIEAAAAIRELEFDRNQWRVDCEEFRLERDDAVIKRAAWELAARQMEAERDALAAQVAELTRDKTRLTKQRDAANTTLETYRTAQKNVLAQRDAAEAKVARLEGKIRDWEARIDDAEWSTNSSLTEGIRAEMRAALTEGDTNG